MAGAAAQLWVLCPGCYGVAPVGKVSCALNDGWPLQMLLKRCPCHLFVGKVRKQSWLCPFLGLN